MVLTEWFFYGIAVKKLLSTFIFKSVFVQKSLFLVFNNVFAILWSQRWS